MSNQKKCTIVGFSALILGALFAETIIAPILGVLILGVCVIKGQLWELDPKQWEEH